jgi:hypothetical protein
VALDDKLLAMLESNLRWIGVFGIFLGVSTWALDLGGLVHECVYCRTQRTAIGVLGVLLTLPDPRLWWLRYGAAAVGFFGASISAAQLFLIVRNINDGEPFGVLNLFMATGALFALTGMVLLVFRPKPHA